MGEFAIGQSVLRREDPRLLRGLRPLFRRFKTRRSAPCGHRALAACARRHPRHRHGRGADKCPASTPCSPARIMPRTRSARCRRWRRTRNATAARCICRRGRRSPSIASCMSAIRSRWWSPTRLILLATPPKRIAVDYAPRPAVVSARDAFEPRRAAALRRLPEQRGLFLPGRRQGQDRCSVCECRACGRATPRHQPRHRQSDRAARRHRRLRRRHAALHVALRLPAALAVPQRHRPHHAENSRSRAAADHRRHRRLLRAARLGLSGNHFDAVGGAQRSAGR